MLAAILVLVIILLVAFVWFHDLFEFSPKPKELIINFIKRIRLLSPPALPKVYERRKSRRLNKKAMIYERERLNRDHRIKEYLQYVNDLNENKNDQKQWSSPDIYYGELTPYQPEDPLPSLIETQIRETKSAQPVEDLSQWEYVTDGKKVHFINYITGSRVYKGDPLFYKLMEQITKPKPHVDWIKDDLPGWVNDLY